MHRLLYCVSRGPRNRSPNYHWRYVLYIILSECLSCFSSLRVTLDSQRIKRKAENFALFSHHYTEIGLCCSQMPLLTPRWHRRMFCENTQTLTLFQAWLPQLHRVHFFTKLLRTHSLAWLLTQMLTLTSSGQALRALPASILQKDKSVFSCTSVAHFLRTD